MAKKKKLKEEPIIEEHIQNETLEEVMGTRYATYAKYVIQERAIPDARDGLKPVQRRIIYSMYIDNNVYNKPTRKSAKTVGAVMGNFHPHGDSSIYDALARMSQDWKVRVPLIDFQGNNGSIDGDIPAASRYTEVRLAQISDELVRDIDKNTVDMTLTFDDTDFEPTVLPSRFPNLFVNGSEGIAVAMATEIPPHNLKEMIEATIYRIGHTKCNLDDLLQFVKGPDFPTGGLIYDGEGLRNIYETGRGRIEIGCKTEIKKIDGINQIIITEVPYKCIKKDLVYQLDKIRHDHVIDGISEVRDESDKSGLRVAIDIKDSSDPEVILKYLISKKIIVNYYTSNIVAIVDGRPKTLSLIDYLDCYIAHQVDVLTRRSTFDLEKSKARQHIVQGLIKAVSILDQVVATIRGSKDKADAKTNIETKFGFTPQQSEAIVNLQLYKLTNTDITTLENENNELSDNIEYLNGLLSDRKKLDRVLVNDLKTIATKYGDERRTQIVEKEEIAPIDRRQLIAKEEVVVALTRDGYVKRSSLKSYKTSLSVSPGIKEGDVLVMASNALTTDYIIAFTNRGNFLFIPVYEIVDGKWKDEGRHINYLITTNNSEKIVRAFVVRDFVEGALVALVTKKGQIKRTYLKDFNSQRYTRSLTAMSLQKDDELVDACLLTGNSDILIVSATGKGTYFNENELTPLSVKASGVKCMSPLKNDSIAAMFTYGPDEKSKIILLTDNGCQRIFDSNLMMRTQRLGKNQQVFKSFKSDPHSLVYACKVVKKDEPLTLYAVLSSKSLQEIVVNDFHLTPIDKYAKANITLPKGLMISFVYNFDCLTVDKDMKTYSISPSGNSTPSNGGYDGSEEEKSDKEEKDDESEYEQISIFDDMGD